MRQEIYMTLEENVEKKNNKTIIEEWKKYRKRMVKEGIKKATGSVENFIQYLGVLAHFSKYSTQNSILIYLQNKDATRVMEKESWKRYGTLKGNAKPMTICIPLQLDDDGRQEFGKKDVFDVSDVDLEKELYNESVEKDKALKALVDCRKNGICKVEGKNQYGEEAWFDLSSGCIYVNQSIPPKDIFPWLAYALAAYDLHYASNAYKLTKDERLEAKCIAIAFCKKYNFDASVLSISFPEEIETVSEKDLLKFFYTLHSTFVSMDFRMGQNLYDETFGKFWKNKGNEEGGKKK